MPHPLTPISGATPVCVRRTQMWLGATAIVVGAMVLIGWATTAQELTGWWAAAQTRPLSALGFVIAGSSLAMTGSALTVARRCLAALTAAIGVAVLTEWTIRPLGTIDVWLQHGQGDAAARPSAHVAIALVLFGVARACSDLRPRGVRMLGGVAATAFVVMALIVDVGFMMGAHVLIGPSRAQGIPAPTAAAVFLLGSGMIISQAAHQPIRWLWNTDLAGRVTRRLVPPAVLLPLAFGIIYLLASIDGPLDTRSGLVMLTSAMITALISLVTVTGSLVERIQRERDNLTRQLDAFFAHTPASMSLRARDGTFIRVNRLFAQQTHFDPKDMIGVPMSDVYPPELLPWAQSEIDHVLATGVEVNSQVRTDLGDGMRDFDVTRFPVFDDRGDIVGIGTLSYDVTERRATEEAVRAAERRYRELSERDPLTGLYNRRRFMDALTDHLELCRIGTPRGSVLSIDLDGFKEVNDRLGHDMGDQLLIAVGEALVSRLRSGDTVARHGGDELLVLLDDGGEDEATTVAHSILDAIRGAARGLDPAIFATASIGLVVISDLPTADLDPAPIMRRADRALYAAKNAGRDQVAISKE